MNFEWAKKKHFQLINRQNKHLLSRWDVNENVNFLRTFLVVKWRRMKYRVLLLFILYTLRLKGHSRDYVSGQGLRWFEWHSKLPVFQKSHVWLTSKGNFSPERKLNLFQSTNKNLKKFFIFELLRKVAENIYLYGDVMCV